MNPWIREEKVNLGFLSLIMEFDKNKTLIMKTKQVANVSFCLPLFPYFPLSPLSFPLPSVSQLHAQMPTSARHHHCRSCWGHAQDRPLRHLRTCRRQPLSLLYLLSHLAPSKIFHFQFLLTMTSHSLTIKSHSRGQVATAKSRGEAWHLWPRHSSTPSSNRKNRGRTAQQRQPWPRLRLSIHGSTSLAKAWHRIKVHQRKQALSRSLTFRGNLSISDEDGEMPRLALSTFRAKEEIERQKMEVREKIISYLGQKRPGHSPWCVRSAKQRR